MFERFDDCARQVLVFAQDEARALRHNYIGTEHILVGLLREEESVAARVLDSFELTIDEARGRIARIVGQGNELTYGQIPFTPRAKKVLELSAGEARALGHNYVSTEHILLGLARESGGVAARILLDFADSARDVAARVVAAVPTERKEHAETFSETEVADVGTASSWPAAETVGNEVGRLRSWTTVVEWSPWISVLGGIGIGILIAWAIWG